jgi:Family of unknown function (DUF6939)
MNVEVINKRRSAAWIARSYPGAVVIDVTSRGPQPWIRLSPFFPHKGIPVPFTPGRTGASVEGIWQALKVFEHADVDEAKLDVTTMKGLKRTAARYGAVLGHRRGLFGDSLLGYEAARRAIYLPSYRWVLDGPAKDTVSQLRTAALDRDLVLLDYTTNGDVTDLSQPLSHAALIALYLLDRWPIDLAHDDLAKQTW